MSLLYACICCFAGAYSTSLSSFLFYIVISFRLIQPFPYFLFPFLFATNSRSLTLMQAGRDVLAESRKHPRQENQGTAQETYDLKVKRVRESYEAVKAAKAEKKYKEGIKLCTEGLKDDDLPITYRKRFLIARSTLYSSMGTGHHHLAVRDAKKLILLTPNSATAYLRAAMALYAAGHKAKAIKALIKAQSLTITKSELHTYIKDLMWEWNPTLIDTLGNDILIEVMSYLEPPDLANCFRTCRRWKGVLSNNSVPWRRGHIVLKGKAQRIATNWSKILRRTNGGKMEHLSILLDEKNTKLSLKENTLLYRWILDSMRQVFPSDTLVTFEYRGACKAIDDQIWHMVKSCKRLRSLKWTSFSGFGPDGSGPEKPIMRRVYDHHIKGSPLANCRLEEFHFENHEPTFLDYSYVALLGQAKKLSLQTYLSPRRLMEILFTRESKLEEVVYTVSLTRDIPIYEKEYKELPRIQLPSKNQLNNLITLKGKVLERNCAIPELWNLSLPKVTSAAIDCSLVHLDSFLSSENLISLEYNFQDDDCDNSFEDTGLKLPNCETLSLSFEFDRYLDEFWTGARHVDPSQRIVPRLKNFSIDGLGTLTGADLVNFVRSRIKFGTPLNRLQVMGCEKVDYESVSLLRKMVPNFVYRAARPRKEL